MKRSFARRTSILPPHGATIAARWKHNTHNWPARLAPSPAKQPCLTGQYREPRGTRNKKTRFTPTTTKKTRLLDRHNKKRSFVIRRAAASCRSTKKSKNGPIKKNKYFPQAPGACPSTRTRRFLAGLFYGHGAAKPASQMISLCATSF